MTTTAQIDAFLACKRIGFAGVSTNPDDFSRAVFREFVARGYDVIPIHPTAKAIEGRPAFASVLDAPKLDAVFLMTPPRATETVVQDCNHAGVKRIWMHRGVGGPGAVEWHAVQYAKAFGIDVIEGECPMMFFPDAAKVHRVHGSLRRAFGHYPDVAENEPAAHRVPRAIGYGAVAWMLATWAMLAIGGIFAWKTGLASRFLVLPISFGVLAWIHAGPGRLAPLATAAWFTIAGLVLDALVLCALVERSAALLGSLTLTWIPYVLAFATAVFVGTRHQRPFVRTLKPAHV